MRIYLTPKIEIEEISVVDVIAASGEPGNTSPKPGTGEMPGRPIVTSFSHGGEGYDVSGNTTTFGDSLGNF